MNIVKWIETEEELPAYGVPVLIVIGVTVQRIKYMLDGADDVSDWFEPYYFEHDDELKISHNKIKKWLYLPEDD